LFWLLTTSIRGESCRAADDKEEDSPQLLGHNFSRQPRQRKRKFRESFDYLEVYGIHLHGSDLLLKLDTRILSWSKITGYDNEFDWLESRDKWRCWNKTDYAREGIDRRQIIAALADTFTAAICIHLLHRLQQQMRPYLLGKVPNLTQIVEMV